MVRRHTILSALTAFALLVGAAPAHADDFTVTKERKAAIAKVAPAAKKFVLAEDLIAKALAKKPQNALELRAAFDKVAKGKWILFTSGLSSEGSTGFMLNVTWGEGDPYRETLLIVVKNAKGFDSGRRELGPRYPMLVKYKGKLEADPGYDLMGLGAWP